MLQNLLGDTRTNCVIGFKTVDQWRCRKADLKSKEATNRARSVARNKKRKREEVEEEEVEVYGAGVDDIL